MLFLFRLMRCVCYRTYDTEITPHWDNVECNHYGIQKLFCLLWFTYKEKTGYGLCYGECNHIKQRS